MTDPDFDFDDLNPPLASDHVGDVIAGILAWALLIFAVGALWVWLT